MRSRRLRLAQQFLMLRLGRGNVGVQSLVEQRALFGIDLNKVSMKPAAAHCSLFLPNFRRRSWAISNESFAVGADMGEKHPSIPQDGSHLDTEVNPPHYSAPYDDMD